MQAKVACASNFQIRMNVIRKLITNATRIKQYPLSNAVVFPSIHSYAEMSNEDPNAESKYQRLRLAAESPPIWSNKITIIGCGEVGLACGICVLAQKISNNICFVDKDEKQMFDRVQDMKKSATLSENTTINVSTDYKLTADSCLCIITASSRPSSIDDQLRFAKDNAEIVQDVVPKFIKTSPASIIIIVTSPVDIMTYVAWKTSSFPQSRVFGTASALDALQTRFFLSRCMNFCPIYYHGLIVSDLPAWSEVHATALNPMRKIEREAGVNSNKEYTAEDRNAVSTKTSLEALKKKGCLPWAIALTCATIAEAVIKNAPIIMPVSTFIKGLYCIDKDVCLSVPCIVSRDGATAVLHKNLTGGEIEQLQLSADIVHKIQLGLNIKF